MSTISNAQDAMNKRVYHRPGVERAYRSRSLECMEAMALLKHQAAFARKDVLDVGVGTGRTSIYLHPLSRCYVGIDYSPVMAQHMAATLPQIPVRLADMRALPEFDDGAFDFIFAPNNVIDAVGHDDRLRTLREFRRILRPDGTLMFSTHNRDYTAAAHGPRMRVSRNPVNQVVLVAEWLQEIANHSRMKPLRVFTPEYALLDDIGHHYACLHYYIGQARQRRQLADTGFELVEVFDRDGRSLDAADAAADSAQLMYVAKCTRAGQHDQAS